MMVSLMNPMAVELSVWMGDLGCFHPISSSALRRGIISLVVLYSAASLASAADAMTNLMICDMVRTGPFCRGMGSSLERKMCAPAQLHDPCSVRKLVPEWVASTIELAR